MEGWEEEWGGEIEREREGEGVGRGEDGRKMERKGVKGREGMKWRPIVSIFVGQSSLVNRAYQLCSSGTNVAELAILCPENSVQVCTLVLSSGGAHQPCPRGIESAASWSSMHG